MNTAIMQRATCYCQFCREEHNAEDCIEMKPCGHCQCRESAAAYIQIQLAKNIAILRCQVIGCSSEISQRQVRTLCSREDYLHYAELAGKHALVQHVDEENLIL